MTLRQRWMALWVRLGVPGDAGVVYDDLVARYSEPHRAYHTLEHIEHCLSEFEQVRQLIANPDAVELALWFHDAIYNTRTKDSEARSAELALKAMRSFSLPDRIGQLVASLIMATTHTAIPTDPDTQLFVDIDLSIFGQH